MKHVNNYASYKGLILERLSIDKPVGDSDLFDYLSEQLPTKDIGYSFGLRDRVLNDLVETGVIARWDIQHPENTRSAYKLRDLISQGKFSDHYYMLLPDAKTNS